MNYTTRWTLGGVIRVQSTLIATRTNRTSELAQN
jgi:hypothetical protein